MIKENLKIQDINFINSCLVNDEYSTDEEMENHFIKELNISKDLAEEIISHRQEALLNELNFDILDYIQKWKYFLKLN